MSEIIDLTKNSIAYWRHCKFMEHAIFFANIFVRTVLTDLLDTSCQQLYPIVNIVINHNFEHCHNMYTTQFYQ